jgi:hypothetical protein
MTAQSADPPIKDPLPVTRYNQILKEPSTELCAGFDQVQNIKAFFSNIVLLGGRGFAT